MNKIEKYVWSENYLINQGYNKVDIDKYFNIKLEIIKKIKNEIFTECTINKKREKKLILLFGQPGCGKSTYMNKNAIDDYVILDIDTYREFHPYKNEIINIINKNHEENKLPEKNSPGRDFTNFTRRFIGILFDEIFEECIKQGYNIALQKHASNYKDLEKLLKKLQNNDYETSFILPLISSKISWERCKKRNIINDMVLNTVPKEFHDNYVSKIPQTVIDIIENYILKEGYISKIEIINNKQIIIINKNTDFDANFIKKYISDNLEI